MRSSNIIAVVVEVVLVVGVRVYRIYYYYYIGTRKYFFFPYCFLSIIISLPLFLSLSLSMRNDWPHILLYKTRAPCRFARGISKQQRRDKRARRDDAVALFKNRALARPFAAEGRRRRRRSLYRRLHWVFFFLFYILYFRCRHANRRILLVLHLRCALFILPSVNDISRGKVVPISKRNVFSESVSRLFGAPPP